MAQNGKPRRKERRAPGNVEFDDRGNSVWSWNDRTEAYSLDDTGALLEQLDNEELALADTAGVEVDERLRELREEHEIYQRPEEDDDGWALYPRDRFAKKKPKPEPKRGSAADKVQSIDDPDVGFDPYNAKTGKPRRR